MAWLNTFGLFLDRVGVFLLFWYGVPFNLNTGSTTTTLTSVVGGRWQRHQRRSRLGLALMLIGFEVQMASNHL